MSTESLDAAVIGCGAIANEHLAYLSEAQGVRLAAVCDVSKITAEFARERFGADRSFLDASDMMAQARPDVVHVLTPPHTHKPLVELCLAAGAHVICEKPMTGSAAETADLLSQARRRGKLLIENRNVIYNDMVGRIDELIADGRLGRILEVDILISLDLAAGPFGDLNLEGPGVRLPAGAVHDFLPHLAYLFLHFAGPDGEAERVVGVLENRSGNPRVGYDHLDALVRVGGCRGRLRLASDLKPDAWRLTVRGSKGLVESDLFNPFLRFQDASDAGIRAPFEQVRAGLRLAGAGFANFRNKVMQHGAYHSMPRMLDRAYGSIREGRACPTRDAETMATARLIDRLAGLGSRA